MATHSNILAWKIPWTEKPGGLQSMESQRVGHDWAQLTHTLSILDTPWSVPHILPLHSAQQLPATHEHRCQKDEFSLRVTLLGTRCENYGNVSISLVSLGPSVRASQVVPSPLTRVAMGPPGGAGGLHPRSWLYSAETRCQSWGHSQRVRLSQVPGASWEGDGTQCKMGQGRERQNGHGSGSRFPQCDWHHLLGLLSWGRRWGPQGFCRAATRWASGRWRRGRD